MMDQLEQEMIDESLLSWEAARRRGRGVVDAYFRSVASEVSVIHDQGLSVSEHAWSRSSGESMKIADSKRQADLDKAIESFKETAAHLLEVSYDADIDSNVPVDSEDAPTTEAALAKASADKRKMALLERAKNAPRAPVLPIDRQTTNRQIAKIRHLLMETYPNQPIIGIDKKRLERGTASLIIECLSSEVGPSWSDLRDFIIENGAYYIPSLKV